MHSDALWFSVIYAIACLYALLDGFDLGVGILSPFVPREDRPKLMRAIAPFWDGNEVWLVALEQTLMGVFPAAYGAILSGMYTPFLILTAALVLRVCAMEFRGKFSEVAWLRIWDFCFWGASVGAAICYGLILGFLAKGLPLTPSQSLDESAMHWRDPFPWVFAGGVVALFALHGAIYLILKTREELQARARQLSWICWGLAPIALGAVALSARDSAPQLLRALQGRKWEGLALIGPLLIMAIALCLLLRRAALAFIGTGGLILWGIGLYACANFPYLVRASNDIALSLTAQNCITSPEGLVYIKWSLLLGVPLVLTYTGWIYWLFRGPVEDQGAEY